MPLTDLLRQCLTLWRAARRGDVDACYAAWTPLMRDGWRHQRASADFEACPVHIGVAPPELANPVIAGAARCPHVPFTLASVHPGYLGSDIPQYVDALNRDHRYLDLTRLPAGALDALCAWLVPELGRVAGHPLKLVNVRAWTTPPTTGTIDGPNAWHRDGMPQGIYKALFYCTDVGPTSGSTEIVRTDGSTLLVTAPAGAFLLFDNNALLHRGVAPSDASRSARTVLELTLVPYFRAVVRPALAGLNARFPVRPWTRAA